ncbi:MAG: HD-GYP domain-containing protein [Thermodesulfobacteriota bacterium]
MADKYAEETGRRHDLAAALLKVLFKLIQAAKIHRQTNSLILEGAGQFRHIAEELARTESTLSIRFRHNRIFVEEDRLSFSRDAAKHMGTLYRYFEALGFQELRFDWGPYLPAETADCDQVMILVRLIADAEQNAVPCDPVWARCKEAALDWVEIVPRAESQPMDYTPERKERVRNTYAYALDSVQEVVSKLSGQRRVGINKTIRIAQDMVDLVMSDDPLFMVLSTIRTHDDYTYHHSVNVAILAMCLGKRINLSKHSLERLGLCGMLHDLGKVEVPLDILNKPGKLTRDEFEIMKRHSLDSARLILKLRAPRDRKAKLLLPPFEHHQKYDLSGYPRSKRKKKMSFFGSILSIVDVYDAITSPRVYRKTVMSPDRALGIMLEGMGSDFDPILLKVFINMLGVYPIGTLLLLDDGDLGLVMEKPSELDEERPWMLQLIPDRKGGFSKGETMNLSARNPKTGDYRKNIVNSFHPSVFGIQPADYLF